MSFQLALHRSTYTTLRLGYEQPKAWAGIQALDWSSPHLVIGDADIAWYDWGRQEIALTAEASARFRQGVRRTGEGPMGIPDSHAFRVSLGGKGLYGGILLYPISAMGIAFPVIYIDGASERVVLGVRATHSAFNRYDQLPREGQAAIEVPAIREHFASLGKLVGIGSLGTGMPEVIPTGSGDYGSVLALTVAYRRGEMSFGEYRARILEKGLPAHKLGCAYLLVSAPPPPPGKVFNPALMPVDWQGTWGEVAMVFLLGGLDAAEYALLHSAAHPEER